MAKFLKVEALAAGQARPVINSRLKVVAGMLATSDGTEQQH